MNKGEAENPAQLETQKDQNVTQNLDCKPFNIQKPQK